MSKLSSFIIPAGLVFEQGKDGLSIEHQGDIILHSTLGLPLRRIRSVKGDIELHVDAENLAELSARGSVRVHGAITATRIAANRIEIHGDALVDQLEAGAGGLHIDGNTLANEIRSAGTVEVTGNAEADSLHAGGDLTVSGITQADLISTESGSINLAGVTAQAIASGGDLTINGNLRVDEATATSGTLSTYGTVTAKLLRAGNLSLSGKSTTASTIQGLSAIRVSSRRIRSDILIAPSVHIAPEVSGKITVVETHSESGPNSVKGCLRLSDLEEFGVDTSSYLADRNLSPLGEPDEAPVVKEGTGEAIIEPEEDEDEDEDEDADADAAEDAGAAEDEAAPDAAYESFDEEMEIEPYTTEQLEDALQLGAPPIPIEALDDDFSGLDSADGADDSDLSAVEEDDAEVDIEDDDEISDLAELDLAPLEEGIAEEPDAADDKPVLEVEDEDPLYTQLRDTISQIEVCYEDSELPPAVTQLRELTEARDYITIRDDITNIWHQLLKFHQNRGLRIQPQVTTTFNTINTLVRKI